MWHHKSQIGGQEKLADWLDAGCFGHRQYLTELVEFHSDASITEEFMQLREVKDGIFSLPHINDKRQRIFSSGSGFS